MDNRYRDYVGFPPLLRSGENDGKSFSDFYRASQIELLSALDNVLSQKAEETLTEFAAVKKADVQLQTPLGNRKAQIGINIMGAFAESQSSAFGWQVRAFGGKDNIGGANVGVFFRRVESGLLYGINVFGDYESGDYGDFWRYGIGGELQNRYGNLAANYYTPITDDKRKGATVMFSQEGYDFNLRVNIPRLDFLQVRTDYYNYHGKYGGGNDKGLRYGLEIQPINDLRIGVFYDDGGEKFGGDIAYTYNFGNRQSSQKRESEFAPDLFSPVVREYSQRIMTAQLGPQLRFITMAISVMTATIITPEMISTDIMTMAEIRTTTFATRITMSATRMASVHFTTRIDAGNLFYNVITTQYKYLITLPLAGQITHPFIATINRNWDLSVSGRDEGIVIVSGPGSGFAVGGAWNFQTEANHTITVVQGSEEFVSVAITLTTGTTRMTIEEVISTSSMTLSEEMTITTRLTFFATSTIGATIGAAKVDSHFPPSFPPLSFPPLSPIMVSYGLAKNGDSWIPAMVIPTLAPFPRHSRVGGNPTAPLARS